MDRREVLTARVVDAAAALADYCARVAAGTPDQYDGWALALIGDMRRQTAELCDAAAHLHVDCGAGDKNDRLADVAAALGIGLERAKKNYSSAKGLPVLVVLGEVDDWEGN